MLIATAIVELSRRDGAILALPYRDRRPGRPVSLLDGSIVEVPTPDQLAEAPDLIESCLGLTSDGRPATTHHANLGLVAAYLDLSGVFLLPSGDVAAVYGAGVVPLG